MPLRQQRLRRQQAYKSGSVFSVGPTTARYLILTLLAVFSLMYLIQSAQGSDSIIELRNLEQQKSELGKELTTLKVNDSRIRSLQNLQNSANEQGLVPIDGSAESITVE
jgi:hypothetical protein